MGECSFVVCHTLEEANKAANSYFNHRVIECRIAVKVGHIFFCPF